MTVKKEQMFIQVFLWLLPFSMIFNGNTTVITLKWVLVV